VLRRGIAVRYKFVAPGESRFPMGAVGRSDLVARAGKSVESDMQQIDWKSSSPVASFCFMRTDPLAGECRIRLRARCSVVVKLAGPFSVPAPARALQAPHRGEGARQPELAHRHRS
jgi:hypothetical protein